jgi:hypothetical protein
MFTNVRNVRGISTEGLLCSVIFQDLDAFDDTPGSLSLLSSVFSEPYNFYAKPLQVIAFFVT